MAPATFGSGRHNPFSRSSASPSPSSQPQSQPLESRSSRPKSISFAPEVSNIAPLHTRALSSTSINSLAPSHSRQQSASSRTNGVGSNTFAPRFIKDEELRRGADQIRGAEGDNDFSGKRYVWLQDPEYAFVRGEIIEEDENGLLRVQCDDGSVGAMLGFAGI